MARNKNGASLDAPFLLKAIASPNQVQVMTPAVVTPESQVFAERACEAVAVHEGGGPVTAVAMIVTSFEGVKPWSAAAFVAVPEKYAPLLSAAYCSSYVARLRRSDFIAATYAFSFVFANFGIAIAARMPIITTTIRSSISVKPFLFADMLLLPPLIDSLVPSFGRRALNGASNGNASVPTHSS